jgi:tyrosyl-tRNA synthetase
MGQGVLKTNVFDYLKERGFVQNCTHEAELRKAMEKPITFYMGIDPTADNLHIGHFFGLQVFKILQNYGHHGILLIGNATAMIGDPTFKNDARKMLGKKEVNENTKKIKESVGKFINLEKAKIVFNNDWFSKIDAVEFLCTVGRHFTVAQMLAKECYKNRITANESLTVFEMNYMLMQAYDFVHLNDDFGCALQIGGSDQWGNITAGVELSRKMSFANGQERPVMFGLTFPLLTKADGTKMGKTESGALWLDPQKTSAYEFYQYFINADDRDVEKLLLYFTELPPEEIHKMCVHDIISAKKFMATAVTEKIHGKFELEMPTEVVHAPSGANLVDILALSSIISSKREAREMIQNGAILVDDEKVTDINFAVTKKEFVVKKGKKTFLRVQIKH